MKPLRSQIHRKTINPLKNSDYKRDKDSL